MPKLLNKPNPRRSRSFGGCVTCRKRHVKCDQVRPQCLTCKAIGAECEGFSAEIRWMSAKGRSNAVHEAPSGASRRHLYTESDRQRMSTGLVNAFPIGSVDASLAELDTRSKAQNVNTANIGPFGVINFDQLSSEDAAVARDPGQDTITADKDDVGPLLGPSQPTSQAEISPLTFDAWMGVDDSLQWADLFGLGTDAISQPFDNLLDPLLDYEQEGSTVGPIALSMDRDVTMNSLDGTNINIVGNAASSIDDVLAESQILLKHFKRSVISRMSSLPIVATSPWESIMLKEAVNTLAHLTYLGTIKVTSAKRANLFCLLGLSAYHLAKNPSDDEKLTRQPGEWERVVTVSTIEAKRCMQQSLKYELQGPSKAKYKDQLMASLGLLVLSAITNRHNDARCYLIEAERLMRNRGLAKREISRKARLLHHVYTWCRVIGESTYVLHEPCIFTAAGNSQEAIQRSEDGSRQQIAAGPGSRLDDFLRLEFHHSDNDLEIQEVKEPQNSLRDIHLQDSRENPNTMYTQIYGISETWLSLLSQTTRLANHMEGIKVGSENTTGTMDHLQRRATRLEDMICSFTTQFTPQSTSSKWTPNNHMHHALNSALVIFFYRRVRNVNSLILQSHVDDVISALTNFNESLSEKSWEGPGSPWAAFIAGCEANVVQKRQVLLNWIERGMALTGFHSYESAKTLLLEVWKRKDESITQNSADRRIPRHRTQVPATWIEICREQQVWFMAF